MKTTGLALKYRTLIFVTNLLCMLSFAQAARACTGIRLIAEDGTVVYARTLEFGINLDSNVLIVPRGYTRTGTTPQGENGLKWTSRYASLGANGVGLPYLFDGVNEKGLAAGLFYFPTTAGYMSYNPAQASRTIAPWEAGSWILENFDGRRGQTQHWKRRGRGGRVPKVGLRAADSLRGSLRLRQEHRDR